MALMDDKPRILGALREISGVAAVLPARPKDWTQLPCIVVAETACATDTRDNQPYLTVLEVCIRVFAATAESQAAVASAADDTMQALGYHRISARDEDDAEVYQKELRYKQVFPV